MHHSLSHLPYLAAFITSDVNLPPVLSMSLMLNNMGFSCSMTRRLSGVKCTAMAPVVAVVVDVAVTVGDVVVVAAGVVLEELLILVVAPVNVKNDKNE